MSTAIGTSSARISEWKVVKGGLVAGAAIFGGQLLGFVRQVVIAYLLGTGPPADALSVAFAPVDLWWAVFATTVIFGFGPLLALPERTPAFSDLAWPIFRLAVAASVLFIFAAEPLVRLLAPGLSAETVSQATQLLRVTATAIPALSLSTLFTALLYSKRRFAFAAFHQGMVNVSTVVVALLLHSWIGAAGFAAGYAAGAWLQLAAATWISWPILRGRTAAHRRMGLHELILGPGPVLSYSLLIGLSPVVTRLKLTGVPLALLVNSLSSSLLSELAPFRLRTNRHLAVGVIGRAAILTALAALAVVLLMIALAPLVVSVLFERGRFSAASTRTVTDILTGFCPVLIAWTALDVISRSMFSLGEWRIPSLCAGLALLINAAGSLSGVISSARWIGLPAVAGFGTAAAVAAVCLWRLGIEPKRAS
jgi:putative peptidoglycan lipid II flippase